MDWSTEPIESVPQIFRNSGDITSFDLMTLQHIQDLPVLKDSN